MTAGMVCVEFLIVLPNMALKRTASSCRLPWFVRRQTNQRRNCDKSLAHTHRIPRHLAGDRRHDILCCHLLGWPARRRPTSMDRASSPHSRLVGGDSLSHPRCPQSLATNWQGQIDVFWQLRRQLQLHCRHWRQHEHWHFWHLPPNNSFKPNLLRYTKAMAEKACHGFGSTTQVGLTQALGSRAATTRTSRKSQCGASYLYLVGSLSSAASVMVLLPFTHFGSSPLTVGPIPACRSGRY